MDRSELGTVGVSRLTRGEREEAGARESDGDGAGDRDEDAHDAPLLWVLRERARFVPSLPWWASSCQRTTLRLIAAWALEPDRGEIETCCFARESGGKKTDWL